MATSIRSVEVTIEVDTNKSTQREHLVMSGEEALEEFNERVLETLRELTEVS